jgi:hypothetical protein
MARILQPSLRPLPRTVKPFPAETTSSYLTRLAHANRLDPKALRFYITGHRLSISPFPVDKLAAVSGLPARTLRYAIPDLAIGYGPTHDDYPNATGFPQRKADDGPPCRLCVLARGITMPVRCWKRPEGVICQRHRLWIGPGAVTSQPDLSTHPDILAHKTHLRLVRRHGRDTVALDFAVADHICRRWHEHGQNDAAFRDRMLTFHGPGWQPSPASATTAAAIYPQAVALTRLLASPRWMTLASSAHPDQQGLFADELRRTVAPGYPWPPATRPADPLGTWIYEHYMSGYSPYLFRYHSWPAIGAGPLPGQTCFPVPSGLLPGR